MNKLRSLIVASVLGASAALGGCGGGGEATVSVVPTQNGTVTLHWSVDGSFDPRACDAFAVAHARVDIYDYGGAPISTTFVDCRAFAATFELQPGTYSARLEMVDSAQQPRTTSLPINSFNVVSGTNLNIDSDFPADSFY
jgi:hypothetical protein